MDLLVKFRYVPYINFIHSFIHSISYNDSKIQGCLFASDVKMHTGICLVEVPFIRCIDKLSTKQFIHSFIR